MTVLLTLPGRNVPLATVLRLSLAAGYRPEDVSVDHEYGRTLVLVPDDQPPRDVMESARDVLALFGALAAQDARAALVVNAGAIFDRLTRATDRAAGLPTEGETGDGPVTDGISQPPHDSLEERRADSVGAAAPAEDGAGPDPEASPTAPSALLQAATDTADCDIPAGNISGNVTPDVEPELVPAYPCTECSEVLRSPGALGGHMAAHRRRGDLDAYTARSRGNEDLGVRMLRALHEAGGEIFDPSGRAATQLFDAVGALPGYARTVLKVLDEAGHVSRTVNGKRTTRVALTASGLAIVDGDTDAPDDVPPVLEVDVAAEGAALEAAVERANGNGHGEQFEACTHTCHLCAATFKSKPALGRHRAEEHPITAPPHKVPEAWEA